MNEWVWSIGGMVLTGDTEILGEKHYIAWVVGEWMGMEHWWNDTDRGNWSTGREKLHSVGGRWMNGYGALVEWYWQGKPKYCETNLSPCHLVHHKSHMDWPVFEPGPPRWEAGREHHKDHLVNAAIHTVHAHTLWAVLERWYSSVTGLFGPVRRH